MSQQLDDLAGAILDREAVDWPAVRAEADPADRALLEQLKVLDAVRRAPRAAPPAASPTHLGPLARARDDRPGRLRYGLSRLGPASRSRGGAETPQVPARPHRRAALRRHRGGATARPRAPPERRHDLRCRSHRRTGRPVDGAGHGPHARRRIARRSPDRAARGRAHRRRVVPGGCGRPCRRPAAPRHQGAQHHAGGGWPTGTDGSRRCSRVGQHLGSDRHRHTALPRAGSAVGRRRHGSERRLQHRRRALSPADAGLPGARRGPRRLAPQSCGTWRCRSVVPASRSALAPASRRDQGARARCRPSIRQRRRDGHRARRRRSRVGRRSCGVRRRRHPGRHRHPDDGGPARACCRHGSLDQRSRPTMRPPARPPSP